MKRVYIYIISKHQFPKISSTNIFASLLVPSLQFICLNLLSFSSLISTLTFYILILLLSLSPHTLISHPKSLLSSSFTLLHEIITGGRHFVHVFLADALCSLSKILFDLGILFSLFCSYPHNLPKNSAVLVIPSLFGVLPFVVRIRQCMWSWKEYEKKDGMEFMHVLNR